MFPIFILPTPPPAPVLLLPKQSVRAEKVSTDFLCFYQRQDGQIIDLGKLCGMATQTNVKPVSLVSPYDYKALKEADRQLYGD
jgi:hypothetical protein